MVEKLTRRHHPVLVTDFVYGVMTLDGSFHHQLLLDLGWFSYQALWGTAALHPSMVELDKPHPVQTRPGPLAATGITRTGPTELSTATARSPAACS